MAVKPVSFGVAEEDLSPLNDVVNAYANGNRTAWLRAHIQADDERLRQDRIARRRAAMEQLHGEMRETRGGKVYSTDETLALIHDLRVP